MTGTTRFSQVDYENLKKENEELKNENEALKVRIINQEEAIQKLEEESVSNLKLGQRNVELEAENKKLEQAKELLENLIYAIPAIIAENIEEVEKARKFLKGEE